MIRKVLIGLLVLFIGLQLFQTNKQNPPSDLQLDFITRMDPPENIQAILTSKCYDCHSQQVTYPWYSYVQPVGWFLQDHITEGREHLNFSLWATYDAERAAHKLEEAFEEVEEGEMPLESYTWVHGGLTNEESLALVNYFKAAHANYDLQHLANEVMDIHDAVMPIMEDLMRLRRSLQAKEKTLEVENAIAAIVEAEEGMMRWMREYEPGYEGVDRKAYLDEEMKNIQKVSDQMHAALAKGGALLKE